MSFTGDPEVKFTKLFINNEFVPSVSGNEFVTVNPSTGDKIIAVSEANADDVNKAVEAAKAAFDIGSPYRSMDPSQRGRLLYKLADAVEANIHYLASLETLDNGKPITMAFGDMEGVVKTLRFNAGYADKIYGKTIPVDGKNFAMTVQEPVGVVGLITAWNFPLFLVANKVAPAVAAGNTIVLKTSEKAPLTALFFASLVKSVGFPPGVINILSGYGPTAGDAIARHPDIDLISFTGSTAVGKHIQKAAGESNSKKVLLECGGKSPLVIMADADLDLAAQVAYEGVFINQGQCCCAATRTFVQESIYDAFVAKAKALADARKTGDPFDKSTAQGPQIDDIQFDKVLKYIESGKQTARLVSGGQRIGSTGYFVQPTIFADVTDDMKIAKEEIFGPVQSIFKFKTLDEAIKRSNETNYGLAAGIVTTNIDNALKYSQAVRAGSVWVNTWMAIGPNTPFGGYKESGHGREMGEEGLLDYMNVKTVVINNPGKP